MGVTERFATFVVETNFETLPGEAISKAREAAFDCLGVMMAAVNEPIGQIIIEYARENSCVPQAGVVGGGFRTSAEMAALANGTLSHALDFDDTGLSIGHPSVCVVPAVLSFGEVLHSSGKETLEALIVGYEIEGKLGFGSKYYQAEKGIHSTSLFGTIGAAAAAAKLLKLDVNQVRSALGIAASQVAGLLRNAGTMTKPLHAGNACRAGIMSAMLAKKGFTADPDILEAEQGFGDTFIGKGNHNEQKMIEKLGNPFHIVSPGLSVKKYPCCFLNHRALDAILQLIKEKDIRYDQVDAVIVGVPKNTFPLRPDANTGFEGKFCLAYNMAAALVDRNIGLGTYIDDMVNRPVIRELMSKVRLQLREDIPIYAGEMLPGRAGNPIAVRLKNGTVYENQVNVLRGSPGAPLTIEEISNKFRDCAKGVLSSEQTERSIELALGMEDLRDVGELMKVVTKLAD